MAEELHKESRPSMSFSLPSVTQPNHQHVQRDQRLTSAKHGSQIPSAPCSLETTSTSSRSVLPSALYLV